MTLGSQQDNLSLQTLFLVEPSPSLGGGGLIPPRASGGHTISLPRNCHVLEQEDGEIEPKAMIQALFASYTKFDENRWNICRFLLKNKIKAQKFESNLVLAISLFRLCFSLLAKNN